MVADAGAVAEVLQAIAETNDELVRAVADHDDERVADLMRQAGALERRRNALLRGLGARRPGSYATTVPLRDQVIRGLRLGGRPLSTRLLADLAQARYSDVIPTTKLASLRRDEASSWKAAHVGEGRTAARDVYVVPALSYDRFAPVRGTLALSSWPLPDRIVAPASPRVDMLRVTLAVADECLTARADAQWLPPLTRLLARLARTVPGLTASTAGDPTAVREAVEAELNVLADADTDEREIASSRAQERLDEYTLLFGATTVVHRDSSVRGA